MWPCVRRRRSFLSRCTVPFGVKTYVIFSIFIMYHLFREQDNKTSNSPGVFRKNFPSLNGLLSLKRFNKTVAKKLSTTRSNKVKSVTLRNMPRDDNPSVPPIINSGSKQNLKFLFVLHHYEQLTKTTENLLQLAAVAEQTGRVVVEPLVRDSRMCGLPDGWSGQRRSEARKFHPMSLYFDVTFMKNLLKRSRYAPLVKLETFKRECQSSVTNTTLLHFMYSDRKEEEMVRWYKISSDIYQKTESALKKSGWCECNFIDGGLNFSNRIGNFHAGRQICLDAEKIKSLQLFKSKILKEDKCVTIIHWRGIGTHRCHFEPEVNIESRKLVYSLRSSEFVNSLAKKIIDTIGEEYISIHIRAERQILWYGFDRLSRCIEVLMEKVKDLQRKYKIKRVFLSSDFTRFGSDTLRTYTSQNISFAKKIKEIWRYLSKTLKPTMHNPSFGDALIMDSGVVALTEKNVLIEGSHLLTIGSGTFQQWIVDGFIERKINYDKQKNWIVTRICLKEDKVNNYKPS